MKSYKNIFLIFIALAYLSTAKAYTQDCRIFYKQVQDFLQEAKTKKELQAWLKDYQTCLQSSKTADTLWLGYHQVKFITALKEMQLEIAEKHINLALEIVKRNNLTTERLSIEFSLGLLYTKQKKIVQAIQCYQTLLPAIQKEKNKLLESKALHNLGLIYMDLYQHEAATSYLEQAQKIALEQKDYMTIGKILMQLSEMYQLLGKSKEAISFAKEASEAYQKIQAQDHIASALARLHFFRFRSGEHVSRQDLDTLLAYLPAIEAGKGGRITKNSTFISIATLMIAQKRELAKAKELLDKNLLVCDSLKLPLNKSHILLAYTDWYKIQNEPEKVYEYYEKYSKLKEQIASEGSRLQLNGLKVLHEIAQQNQKIRELTQKQQITMLWTWLWAVLAVFMGVFVVGVWILWRQRLKLAESKLQEQHLTIENQNLLNELLEEENALKARELTTSTMHIIQKNELLEQLNSEINPLLRQDLPEETKNSLRTLRNSLRENDFFETNWDDFKRRFEEVSPHFLQSLKAQFPDLTPNDLRQCVYIKMNLSRKEIAQFSKVNVEAVKVARNRLKKKLGLSATDELDSFLNRF